MIQHKNVLDFYHCSAFHSKESEATDANAAFQAAELAVQCPLHVLYDPTPNITSSSASGGFTLRACMAFERVFRCFSDIGDNLLSHSQLSALQESCYNSDPLNNDEFDELKEQVNRSAVQ
jgi:hypothetical protein